MKKKSWTSPGLNRQSSFWESNANKFPFHQDFIITFFSFLCFRIFSSAFYHPHFIIRILPSAFFHPHFIIRIFPSVIRHPPSAIRHPPSAIHHPPSAIRRHPVSILQRPRRDGIHLLPISHSLFSNPHPRSGRLRTPLPLPQSLYARVGVRWRHNQNFSHR